MRVTFSRRLPVALVFSFAVATPPALGAAPAPLTRATRGVRRPGQSASPVPGDTENRVRPDAAACAVKGNAGGAARRSGTHHPGDVLRLDGRSAEHPGRQGDSARDLGGE